MRWWCLFLALLSGFVSSAQINYSSLHVKNDSLFTSLGRLYTGNAVWIQTYYPYKIQITFGLKRGKIVYHKILYSKNDQVLVDASYDNLSRHGVSKKYALDGKLVSYMRYAYESTNCCYYVCPDAGLEARDTAFADGTVINQVFFRNGMIKKDDSIFKKTGCSREYDSLGNLTSSKEKRSIILDRLFGSPPSFGLKWFGGYAFVLNEGRGDSLDYGIEVRFNENGALKKVYAWARNIFLTRMEYRCYTNRLRSFVSFKGEICHFKRWDKSNLLAISIVMSKKKYSTLSQSQKSDLNRKIYRADD